MRWCTEIVWRHEGAPFPALTGGTRSRRPVAACPTCSLGCTLSELGYPRPMQTIEFRSTARSGRLRSRRGTAQRRFLRAMGSLVIVASATLVSACRDKGKTVWAQEVASPDGHWRAIAATKQWSGPGAAYVATTVHLLSRPGDGEPIEILAFSNQTAYPLGITSVKMEWASSKHLAVTYGRRATLDFQVIKCGGLDISAQAAP